MKSNLTTLATQRESVPRRTLKMARRRVNTRHLSIETLEARCMLSVSGELVSAGIPDATDNYYLAHDESPVSHNMVTDDTGKGIDTGALDAQPLIVTEINGQSYEPNTPMALGSGASLTVAPDGSFVYDPTTSPILSAIAPGAMAETDSFTYAVSAGFRDIVIFGDSLSDAGNLYSVSGETYPPDPPYWQGRVSNGPVWVEYLAPRLNSESTLENNYAVAGAMTGTGNFNEGRPGFDLPDDLPGLQDQIAQFVGSLTGPADPASLYVVWAGPNNFFLPPADPPAAIAQAVGEIISAVETLRSVGAEYIVVGNMPDLGITPDGLASGMGSLLTGFSQAFNDALQATIEAYSLDVIEFDAFGAFQDVVADPDAFGLANVTDACFDGAGFCGNPGEYLFWDSVHPTTKGHQVLADLIFGQLLTQEPLANRDTATVKISVSDATTPVAILDENLYVGGTKAGDTIVIRGDRSGRVHVRANRDCLGTYVLDPAARVVVFGHEGSDWMDAGQMQRSVILDGGEGNDFLFGGRGSDILNGGAGKDFLSGNAGADTLFGGSGRDLLFGGRDDDTLYGGDGNDFLFGGPGHDVLFGNAGDDWLFGQLGNDELDGGDGADWLFGGPGTDILKHGRRNRA